VVKVYREAIDACYRDGDGWGVQPHWLTELAAISHRGYCTGFYFGDPAQTDANLDNLVLPGYRFVAKVLGQAPHGGAQVLVKNKIERGDAVDVLTPSGPTRPDRILKIVDEYGLAQSQAQPGSTVSVQLQTPPQRLDLIRCPPDEPPTEAP
jgi:putative protease